MESKPRQYSLKKLGLAPWPRRCEWVGPYVHNISCSGCSLGYEEPDDDRDVCVKPPFKPWKHWNKRNSEAYGDLAAAFGDKLYVKQTYRTNAVELEPKRERFVGYSGFYNKITYELDFTGGSQVCIHMRTRQHFLDRRSN